MRAPLAFLSFSEAPVELAVLEPDPIAGPGPLDPLRAEHAAEAVHVYLQ